MTVTKLPFAIGDIRYTRRSKGSISLPDGLTGIVRHSSGEFGEVSESQRRINLEGLGHAGPIKSVQRTSDGRRFSVRTNGHRTITTIRVLD